MRPDPKQMEAAIAAFLSAAGLADRPTTKDTPKRVTKMWLESLIDGEDRSVAELIPKPMKIKARDMIVMRDVMVHTICPHHLLPYEVTAHLAIMPDGYTAGFSRIAHFVEQCAHRLVLIEDLAATVADGLMESLHARGVAVVLNSRQSCMLYQGKARREAKVTVVATRGALTKKDALKLMR